MQDGRGLKLQLVNVYGVSPEQGLQTTIELQLCIKDFAFFPDGKDALNATSIWHRSQKSCLVQGVQPFRA